MAEVRLQKYIAEAGIASRRKAEELIIAGKVRVNGQVVKVLGSKVDPDIDFVKVGNKLIRPQEKGLIIFNKPRGVVTTKSDPEGRPTVMDYMTKAYKSYYPVGRLDWDTSGLIIMTNDGELAEHMMHPRYGHVRLYHAKVEGVPSDGDLNRITRGIRLDDGMIQAEVKVLKYDEKTAWLELAITEGRNHVVKRMMERVGHQVLKLKRVAHGPFKLGKLEQGEFRKLTTKEYLTIRRRVFQDRDNKTK